MTATTYYEKPTDDLRQVRHEEWVGDHLLVYYTAQRRWLVGVGESYNSPERRNREDLMVGDWYPAQGPNFGYRFQPAKSEWRDLPTVRAIDIQLPPFHIK